MDLGLRWRWRWRDVGMGGVHKGWDGRGKVPRVPLCLCSAGSYVVYCVTEISFSQICIYYFIHELHN